MGNCIGTRNHRDFVLFLCLETVALVVSVAVAVLRLRDNLVGSGFALTALSPLLLIFLVADCCTACGVVSLAGAQVAAAARNVTTNEQINSHKYKYLQSAGGDFRNPFDRGCQRNLSDFCLLAAPPQQDLAADVEAQGAGAGAGSGGGGGGLPTSEEEYTALLQATSDRDAARLAMAEAQKDYMNTMRSTMAQYGGGAEGGGGHGHRTRHGEWE